MNTSKARFKRRTLHVPNLMQMSENNRFFSFALDSAHVKFDVWTGPYLLLSLEVVQISMMTPFKGKAPVNQ